MAGVREQRLVDGEHAGRIALGANDDRADERLVDAEMQERRVELAERAKRPELVARLRGSPPGSWAGAVSGPLTVSVATRPGRSICSDTLE